MFAALPATRDDDRRTQAAQPPWPVRSPAPSHAASRNPATIARFEARGRYLAITVGTRLASACPATAAVDVNAPTMSVPSMIITPSTMRLAGRQDDDHQARPTFMTGRGNPPPMVVR